MPKIDFNLLAPDKIGHFAVYALWAMLLGMAWKQFWLNAARRTALKIILIGSLYGMLIEFLQGSLTSNRTFDIADMFANAFGCIIGTILIYLFFRKKRKIA